MFNQKGLITQPQNHQGLSHEFQHLWRCNSFHRSNSSIPSMSEVSTSSMACSFHRIKVIKHSNIVTNDSHPDCYRCIDNFDNHWKTTRKKKCSLVGEKNHLNTCQKGSNWIKKFYQTLHLSAHFCPFRFCSCSLRLPMLSRNFRNFHGGKKC